MKAWLALGRNARAKPLDARSCRCGATEGNRTLPKAVSLNATRMMLSIRARQWMTRLGCLTPLLAANDDAILASLRVRRADKRAYGAVRSRAAFKANGGARTTRARLGVRLEERRHPQISMGVHAVRHSRVPTEARAAARVLRRVHLILAHE